MDMELDLARGSNTALLVWFTRCWVSSYVFYQLLWLTPYSSAASSLPSVASQGIVLIGCQQPSICCISRNRSPSAFRVTTIIFKTFTLVFKHLRGWQWRHFLLHSHLVRTLLGGLTDHFRVWHRRHYLLHCPFAPTLLGNVVDRALRWPCCRVLGSVVFQSFAGKTVEFGIWDNNWRSNCSSASGIREIRT